MITLVLESYAGGFSPLIVNLLYEKTSFSIQEATAVMDCLLFEGHTVSIFFDSEQLAHEIFEGMKMLGVNIYIER